MSGGVDSSVAAALLKQSGHEVIGCFMRLGSPGEELETPRMGDACTLDAGRARVGQHGCCSINDAADARLVAAKLDVPFYVVNFRNDFARIISYFEEEYHAGRTPNPCVRCNDWLKFGKLRQYAEQLGCDAVATGHYARVAQTLQGPRIQRGVDHAKDQSYVLFGVGREALSRMMLPIGEMEKPAVRALAREFSLPVSEKPDSQEICFVPDDYAQFLNSRAPGRFREGAILDESGKELGRHAGHQHFTIGQRKGIGVAATIPLYVLRKDSAHNTVVVGPRESLGASTIVAREVVWYDETADATGFADRACTAQVRAHGAPIPARVTMVCAKDDGAEKSERSLHITFDRPELGVAPGQAIVCYDDEARVLGGGWIAHVC